MVQSKGSVTVFVLELFSVLADMPQIEFPALVSLHPFLSHSLSPFLNVRHHLLPAKPMPGQWEIEIDKEGPNFEEGTEPSRKRGIMGQTARKPWLEAGLHP